MSRLVALLMLALLPLHMSWAAVAPYCAHEAASQSQQHFGHHDHAVAAADEAQDESATNSVQPDCAKCHNHCSGVLLSLATVDVVGSAEQLAPAARSPAADRSPPRPERPQWVRLA